MVWVQKDSIRSAAPSQIVASHSLVRKQQQVETARLLTVSTAYGTITGRAIVQGDEHAMAYIDARQNSDEKWRGSMSTQIPADKALLALWNTGLAEKHRDNARWA